MPAPAATSTANAIMTAKRARIDFLGPLSVAKLARNSRSRKLSVPNSEPHNGGRRQSARQRRIWRLGHVQAIFSGYPCVKFGRNHQFEEFLLRRRINAKRFECS